MKKIIKIIIIILVFLLIDNIQAKIFNNRPVLKIVESYNGGNLYQRDNGILVYTYIFTDETKKTVFKWEKYSPPENNNMNDIDRYYKEKEYLNDGIEYWNGNLYYLGKKIPVHVDNIKQKFNNPNACFSKNRNVLLAYNDNGKVNIIYSNDMGESWNNISIEKNYNVQYITSPDNQTGYIVLISSKENSDIQTYIYASTDGYKTWNEVSKQDMKTNSEICFDQKDIGYFSKSEDEYYATEDGGKSFNKIISKMEAAKIAENEAKNEKYQYQGWKSDFKAILNSDGEIDIVSKLIKELQYNSEVYYFDKQWETDKYEGQLMWEIRLFDENDALTSLYIYIDAKNGEILGAGKLSD